MEQRQFLQLDRQLSAGLAGGLPQLFHADAGAFQLIQQRQQPQQKFRLPSTGAVELQTAAHGLHSPGHGNEPARLVHPGTADAAIGGKYPMGQPGKTEHFGIAGNGIAADFAEHSLRFMGKLLGNNENLSRAVSFLVVADPLEHCLPQRPGFR